MQALFLCGTGGLCYLTNSFATFLAPGFAAHLLPYILVPSFIGEASLSLWLTIAAVNEPNWHRRAGREAP